MLKQQHGRIGELALSLLARDGIAVIWRLNLAAADAYRTGHPNAAESLLDIADAAEAAWLRAQGEPAVAA